MTGNVYRTLFAAPAALAVGLAFCGAASAQDNGVSAVVERASAEAERHWSLLDSYCTECHNFEDWAGGVAFDTMLPEGVPDEAATWEYTIRKLRGRLMPPPGNPQPAQEDIDGFVAWMEGYLDEVAATRPNPGHVPLHRMNRTEYRHAVHGLFGVDIDVAEFLPSDVKAEGFDNIASVLRISPAFLDQYIQAARHTASVALGRADAPADSITYRARGGSQRFHVDGLPLGTRGGLLVEHHFPADGEYVFDIGGLGVGLYPEALEHEHTLVLLVDGEEVFEASIGGENDLRAADQQQAAAREAIEARFQDIRLDIKAGPRQIGVTFVSKTMAESDERLHSFVPGGGMERIPTVGSVDISGPFNPVGVSATPSRERILICQPEREADERPCAERILTNVAEQAFRGPLTDSDVAGFMRFYDMGREEGDFESGIEAGLVMILSSPKFLYRSTALPDEAVAGQAYPLSDLELATRLSFFLWSQGPDRELLDAAANGGLHDVDVLEQQVHRMLADPRASALVTNFGYKWLRVDDIGEVSPDPNLFPHFDEGLRRAFMREMELFLSSVLLEDRSVVELLSADYTYLNERLALHYGIDGVRGDRFRRVRLDDENRWGLLGKGAVLLATSFGNRTSPVVRGDWILHNLMGTPPAPPPPGVETDLSEPDEGRPVTVRQLLEEHRENPSCNACHGVMDPLGLALEHFDVTGEWREMDRHARLMIDAGGELADGTPIRGPAELREALTRNPEQFVQALTEKLMIFGMGRTLEHYDMPVVRRIVREAAADDYRISAIILGIVTSEPFRMRQIPEGDDTPYIETTASRN